MIWVETVSGVEAQFPGDIFLDSRLDAGEGAHGPRDGAGGDLGAGAGQSVPGARKLRVIGGELDPEGGRLGMNAVAAADGRGEFVFLGAGLQRGEQPVEIGQQDVGGPGELDGEAGVQSVGRGHALMDEARVGAHLLGKLGQEGDHIVFGFGLDLARCGRSVPAYRACRPAPTPTSPLRRG